MKHLISSTFLIFILSATVFTAYAQTTPVKLGIEVLQERNFDILRGKRVGLICNATSVDSKLNSTIDILHQAPEVNLVALYGPEHGVRGDVHAGDKVNNIRDKKTGIIVHSLYGKTRKPTPQMLQNIDILIYDIQDIGCRSYTFISTMGLAMEAAAEHGIEFLILDRPNPLGGLKIEGDIAEEGCISFVSQFKIPYIYGLTYGELANMLNIEGMLTKRCKLSVVPMQGWTRDMLWQDTKLQWVPTSPHIPSPQTALLYPATGILGELGYISIGVGYTLPFQMIGAPWIDAEQFASALNGRNIEGITFKPIHFKPFYSAYKGENCQGVQIYITDYNKAYISALQFIVIDVLNELYPTKATFKHADSKRFRMFDLVCGTSHIREGLTKTHRWQDIAPYWNKDVESFRQKSSKYHLYK